MLAPSAPTTAIVAAPAAIIRSPGVATKGWDHLPRTMATTSSPGDGTGVESGGERTDQARSAESCGERGANLIDGSGPNQTVWSPAAPGAGA